MHACCTPPACSVCAALDLNLSWLWMGAAAAVSCASQKVSICSMHPTDVHPVHKQQCMVPTAADPALAADNSVWG